MPALRVLYIEDSPADRELVMEILARENGEFSVVAISALAELEAHLAKGGLDVVLSDFHFPTFDGFQVLETVQNHSADLPLVFVTITGREQLAVDALAAGAADYVVKSQEQLPRLPRALRNAVENRRAALTSRQRDARLTRQRGALLQLTSATMIAPEQYLKSVQVICETAGHALDVRRVGLWRYDWSGRSLISVNVWDVAAQRHSAGAELGAGDFPSYFRALAQFDVIAAHDAHADERTREFSATYLTPHGISSMLDAPVRFSQSRAGVLCFEHVGPPRRWTPDEEAFAISVATLVALVVERSERQAVDRERRRNEAMLAEAERIAGVGSWEIDFLPGATLETVPVRWSDQLFRILGYAPRTFAPSYAVYMSHIPPEEMPAVLDVIPRLFERFETVEIMHRLRRQDGDQRIVQVRAAPVFGGDGRTPTQFLGTIQDVTERERAAAIAREAAHFCQLIIENTREGIAVLDRDLRYQVFNPFLEEISGFRAAETVGRTLDEVAPPKDVETFKPLLLKALAGESIETGDMQLPARTVNDAWVTLRLSPLRDGHGHITGVVVLVTDITQRKIFERALQQSAEDFRLLFQANPMPMWVVDSETLQFITVNEATIVHYGYAAEEFANMTVRDLLLPEDQLELEKAVRSRRRNIPSVGEWRHRRKNGTLLYAAVSRHEIQFQGRSAQLVLAEDVTERRAALAALRESEARFRHMADHAPVMVWMTDASGKATYLSKTWMDITGQTEEQAVGFGWIDALHADDRARAKDQFLRAMEQRERITIDYRLRRRDGTYANVIDASVPRIGPEGEFLGYIGSVIDVTDRLRLEEQLRQAQKMEAIGQLSGGVAHDFNNLLTVIKGHASLLQTRCDLAREVIGPIQEIASAADRAASLTRQLLTLSRQQVMRTARYNLTDLVSNLAQILQRLLTENITMDVKLWSDPLPIHADEGMVEQVLLNFVVNARDAMPRGGKLEITTAATKLWGTESHTRLMVKPGNFAVLCVSDTGTGIPPEVISRIFEPFFTTKGVGHGTGLGLATVYGIMQQHHGTLSVDSEVGRGTTIRAYFPIVKDAPVPSPKAAKHALPTGNETILFVEDEPAVREVGIATLQMLGYRVLPANDAADALRVWEENKGQVALLATDLVMPGEMTGQELAARLRAECPKLPVIFISGYSRDAIGKDLPSASVTRHLAKPFDIASLAKLVREALDTAGR